MKIKTLADRKNHIFLLMEYAVPPEHLTLARVVINRYETDIVALNLFEAFYSYLPEAQDDAISKIILLQKKQGHYLLYVSTLQSNYIYIVSAENAEFLGKASEGIWDENILDFYGYAGHDAFLKAISDLDQYNEYQPAILDKNNCPVCTVSAGEPHVFGCPVEICPWCGGQMVGCNCRFNRLGIDAFRTEEQVEELMEKLEAIGRVPYDPVRHRPSFLEEK